MRRRRELTLAELAAATGIPESTLSRLESGRRRPTLELLLPLTQIYQVAIEEIIGAPETGDPRIHLKPINRYDMLWLPLTRRAGGVQADEVIILAAPATIPDPELPRGLRMDLHPQRAAPPRPRRAGPPPQGRSRRVRHPHPALVHRSRPE